MIHVDSLNTLGITGRSRVVLFCEWEVQHCVFLTFPPGETCPDCMLLMCSGLEITTNGTKSPRVSTTSSVAAGGSNTMARSPSETQKAALASANSPSSRSPLVYLGARTRVDSHVDDPCRSFRGTTGVLMWTRSKDLWWTKKGKWSTGFLENGTRGFTVACHLPPNVSGGQVGCWIVTSDVYIWDTVNPR